MGLNRALAHKKLLGDLAVAQSTGYEFKDLKLTASDMEVLSLSFVRDERSPGRNRDLLHNNCLLFSCQLEAEPDAKNGKGRRDQSAVDFDRMFDYQELILAPPEQCDQDSTDQPVHEHVALHKFLDDYHYHWNYRTRRGVNPRACRARSTLDRLCPGPGQSSG